MSAFPYPQLVIAHAANEMVTMADGRSCIDLFCGSGTIFLGHCNRAVVDALQDQLGRVWNTGIIATAARADAIAGIESFFPSTHRLACLYSTGMEAAEFAVRMARVATGRSGVIGFDRSNHGKSLATASLAWPTPFVSTPDVRRMPSMPELSEAEILERLAAALAARTIAAVFVEPILGSGGGYLASPEYHRAVARLCAEHGTLLVFDEILTGFHRTGSAFMFESLDVMPDVILVGKAMANGFPASGVVVRKDVEIVPTMLSGSTYAGNPLAAAAVSATLRQMRALPMEATVHEIGAIIESELQVVRSTGIALRGRGALWVLELRTEHEAAAVSNRALAAGVIASAAGRWLRLLPPATIPVARLHDACRIIREACQA